MFKDTPASVSEHTKNQKSLYSRRDFLKLGVIGAGGLAKLYLDQKTGSLLQDSLHSIEIGGSKEILRATLCDNLEIPADWPGEKKRLLFNPDYRSAPTIFREAMDKVKRARIQPVFKEPQEKDRVDWSEEASVGWSVLIPELFRPGEGSGKRDLVPLMTTFITDSESMLCKKIEMSAVSSDILPTANFVMDFSSRGLVTYSGISRRACKAAHLDVRQNEEGYWYLSDDSAIQRETLFDVSSQSESKQLFVDSVRGDLERVLNNLYVQSKLLSMSDLIAQTTILNNGDVVSGLVDAMLIMRILTRNGLTISTSSNKVYLSGPLDTNQASLVGSDPKRTAALAPNIEFLSSLFKDEFSLIASMPELMQVYHKNPQYFLGNIQVGDTRNSPMDFNKFNRSGGWYHGLSEMLEYAFFSPEAVAATICLGYYRIDSSIKKWLASNRQIPFIQILRNDVPIVSHGLIKTFSDLAILLDGQELYDAIHIVD